MSLSLSPLSITTLALVIIFALYKFILQPAFLSPLSRIPNAHPTAPFSAAWILWKRYRMQNNRTVHAAHLKYGPVIRLAPYELSVNCVDAGIRTIYAGGFEKHDWYIRLFPSYGVVNMFSQPFSQPHSARKRLMSNVYAKSHIQGSVQLAANSKTLLFERFLPILTRAVKKDAPIDVHDMNNAFTMDFMSAYQFGLACSTRFSLDARFRRHWLHQYHCRKDFEYHKQELPNITKLCKAMRIPFVPKYVDEANDELEDWGLRMCDSADAYLDLVEGPGNEPVVYKQLKKALEKQNKPGEKDVEQSEVPLTKEQQRFSVASEMLDHLGAGHETSAICLTYLQWEMSKRSGLQKRLREELLTLEPPITWPVQDTATQELPHPKSIDNLPLLHAILMETLRLHGPIPGPEPRITPLKPTTLGEYTDIPPGVRVSAQAYSLHRNADVFPDPGTWKYDRWLQGADTPEMKEMLRWFWAFGSGGRMCIGSNLAMQEMKLLIAAIYTNFVTEIADDEGIEEIDAYTIRPRSNRLMLRFSKAS